jgi:hypothetical protein
MPIPHDKYKCAGDVLEEYWDLIDSTGWEPIQTDFENGQTLKTAIGLMLNDIKAADVIKPPMKTD